MSAVITPFTGRRAARSGAGEAPPKRRAGGGGGGQDNLVMLPVVRVERFDESVTALPTLDQQAFAIEELLTWFTEVLPRLSLSLSPEEAKEFFARLKAGAETLRRLAQELS